MNSIGGAVNNSVYAIIVSHLGDAFLVLPILAVAAGSICGLTVNFLHRKRVVFERGRPERTRRPQRTEMLVDQI